MTSDMQRRGLDFSQAHFLDHSLLACGQRPEVETGGRRRHIHYWWMFKGKPALLTVTLCRVGVHKPGRMYRPKTKFEQWVCVWCMKGVARPEWPE